MIGSSKLTWLGILTITVFPLIGFIVAYYALDLMPIEVLQNKRSWEENITIGIGVGVLSGLIARQVILLPFMKPVLHHYGKVIGSLRVKNWQIWFVSFCAGAGEELLFRGALQPMLGIWVTAIVFVAIHGYLNPWDWRISFYGVVMTLLIACLGWMTDYFGIVSAMIAHMMIDVILLQFLLKVNSHIVKIPEEDAFKNEEFFNKDVQEFNNSDLD